MNHAEGEAASAPPTDPPFRCAAIVMAGGLGTRMRSRTPKVLHELCGRPMLAFVLDAARGATGAPPVVVYSPATEAIVAAFDGQARFALQERPDGTGDALRAGLAAVGDDVADVVVLSGDVPLVDPDLVVGVLERRREEGAAVALATFETWDAGALGRVVRTDDGSGVARIVEAKDATAAELSTSEVNAGLYAFDGAWLRRSIGRLVPSPATGELYLTGLIDLAVADGRRVEPVQAADDGSLDGINDRAQLAEAAAILQDRINSAWMAAGVTMVDPATAYIDATVELAPDVVLDPNVILRGRTRVGEGTRIGSGSQLIDTSVGRGCLVWASVLEASEVADDVRIGPFSHLRPGSVIDHGARLGNFAEVKNSHLGPGVQQHHMSYLGDAEVGERTNVGAGTITANYDGIHKHRTIIGTRVFLGVDTMLRAPVSLGDGARTGAGAVVLHDVPAGKLAVGVPATNSGPTPAGRESRRPLGLRRYRRRGRRSGRRSTPRRWGRRRR